MVDYDKSGEFNGLERRSASSNSPAAKPGTPRRRRSDKGRRHATITATLPDWHSYRKWAYKQRGSWENKR